jgi:hypothetical protein
LVTVSRPLFFHDSIKKSNWKRPAKNELKIFLKIAKRFQGLIFLFDELILKLLATFSRCHVFSAEMSILIGQSEAAGQISLCDIASS